MSMRVPEDVVAVKSTGNAGEYAVLRKCPAESAARLRVLEKHFVVDHAQRFGRGSCLGNPELAKILGTTSRTVGKQYRNWPGSNLRQITSGACVVPGAEPF
jgi:hypothetical protein